MSFPETGTSPVIVVSVLLSCITYAGAGVGAGVVHPWLAFFIFTLPVGCTVTLVV